MGNNSEVTIGNLQQGAQGDPFQETMIYNPNEERVGPLIPEALKPISLPNFLHLLKLNSGGEQEDPSPRIDDKTNMVYYPGETDIPFLEVLGRTVSSDFLDKLRSELLQLRFSLLKDLNLTSSPVFLQFNSRQPNNLTCVPIILTTIAHDNTTIEGNHSYILGAIAGLVAGGYADWFFYHFLIKSKGGIENVSKEGCGAQAIAITVPFVVGTALGALLLPNVTDAYVVLFVEAAIPFIALLRKRNLDINVTGKK